nr:polyketide synthase [Aspergillus sp.]
MSDPITASAAFFNPQSRAPSPEDLSALYTYLNGHRHGRTLLRHVSSLSNILPIFGQLRADVRNLPNAEHYAGLLVSWAKGGPSAPVSQARTGIISLPLLLILQLGEYLKYLEYHSISHADFIAQVKDAGGIQGCCGGEPPALSIACAKTEEQVMDNALVLLRIVMGVGAYIEALDDWTSSESTIIAVRLKYAGQGEELMRMFPHTYISAITEPRSLSFVGNAKSIAALHEYCQANGLPADKMDVTGKAHNPENAHVVPEFLEILGWHPALFQLPKESRLQVTVRSNRDGVALTDEGIMEDMIPMMLASCCDWYQLLSNVAADIKKTNRTDHRVVIFGLNDSVPLSPFNRQRLKIFKFKANELLAVKPGQPDLSGPDLPQEPSPPFQFPESSIAITGLSCRFPRANNLAELWELISSGTSTAERVPLSRINPAQSYRASQDEVMNKRTFFGNFLDDIKRFDNTFFGINPKEAASMDPQQRMLLELAYEALESSGYVANHVRTNEDPVGCFIGGSLNEYLTNTSAHSASAHSATGTIRAFMCGRISYYFGWTGPSEVIDTACSSSLVAINRACRAIQAGDCTMAIAGGVNALTGTVDNFLDLGKAGFLSQTGQCKPFDEKADGYCRAEGAGLVVLKKLSDALREGDKIYGVIPASATNQGGTSSSLTVPSPSALKDLYRGLFKASGLSPAQISYVEAHGTGTQAGDPIEIESIREVLTDRTRSSPVAIGSIKGNIGHGESAAGVAGLLKVLAMMQHGRIAPVANHNRLNPKIPPLEQDGFEIPRQVRDWTGPRAALVNSYGAAGSNSALLCCESPNSSPAVVGDNVSIPVIISAASRASLVDYAKDLAGYLSTHPDLTVAEVAFTLNQRRKRNRFCFETSSTSLPSLIQTLKQVDSPSFELPRQNSPVILALSGQFDNKVALDRTLYETYPAFRASIDACNATLIQLGYPSIESAIFQKTPISTALSLQCSIFAVQYASARCWLDGGLKPAAVIGHSLGEIVALAVSGALSLSDCLKLIAYRASLIDKQWGPERGAMLAVHSSQNDAKRLIARVSSANARLEIACYNAPTSIITAGTARTVDLAQRILETDPAFAGVKYTRLSTTHAFHSELAETIMPSLGEFAGSLKWNEPSIRLETCTSAPLGSIREWDPARHARDPVYFVDAVQRLEKEFGSKTSSNNPALFAINTRCERFQKVVSGHAVLRQPLCPAPLHIESVTNAIQLLVGDEILSTHDISFSDLFFQSPLGLDPSREVELRLEEAAGDKTWKFTVRSSSSGSWTGPSVSVHSVGMATLSPKISLSTYTRLVDGAVSSIHGSKSLEHFGATRAYGLFTKVMHYAPFFKGIQSMTVNGDQALASIKLPAAQPGRSESLCWKRIDAVLIDAFISVVGLLLNSSDDAAEGQILIAVGIEKVVLTAACAADSDQEREWNVYAKFFSAAENQRVGDVFVYDSKGEVVAFMSGVQFNRLEMAKLTKVLVAANANTVGQQQQQQQVLPVQAAPVKTVPVQTAPALPIQTSTSSSSSASNTIFTPAEDAESEVEEEEESPDMVIKNLISNYTGLNPDDILSDAVLPDLGIDSLSLIEFSEELNGAFGSELGSDELRDMTLEDLVSRLSKKSNPKPKPKSQPTEPTLTNGINGAQKEQPVVNGHSHIPAPEAITNGIKPTNPFDALLSTDKHFQSAAKTRGYTDFEFLARPVQDLLVQAYILEGFAALGVPVLSFSPGSVIPRIPHIPKHAKLVAQFWDILQVPGIVAKQGNGSIILRGRNTPTQRSAADLYEEFTTRFPAYLPEARLIRLAGENLAKCLTGELDPVTLMFGSPASSRIMEDYYANSPMVSTLTDQLVTFVTELVRGAGGRTVRILEVGAGTGGTTMRLAQNLDAAGLAGGIEYTFTDISGRFVTKAKDKLKQYPWIKFDTFDLEKDISPTFSNRFDIVIGTNCVHATSSRVQSTRRLNECLVDDGVVILSEGTYPLAWFDLTFGLLDGWWVAENGTEYPLQNAQKWMQVFHEAGFKSAGFSRGEAPGSEATMQQLLVGCKKEWPSETDTSPESDLGLSLIPESQTADYRLETLIYKEVDGVQIHADIYLPRNPPNKPLAIALLIHGGGFMMLSRKCIRPAQTKHLLAAGFLPISIDYRLCPEVNLINGPMADARDAYVWARTQLPSILSLQGLRLDTERVVAVGWSTGGHLAMSLAWTAAEAGMDPPKGVLAFYAPVQFEDGDLDAHARKSAPRPKQSREAIIKNLGRTPITTYTPNNTTEATGFFGLQPGDPRSDLILSVANPNNGSALPLLVNQIDTPGYLDYPPAERIARISPLAQVQGGRYMTPTVVVNSRLDQVVPFAAAERFVSELEKKGVRCRLVGLDGVPHLHDLYVRPGTQEWEEGVAPGYRFLEGVVGDML